VPVVLPSVSDQTIRMIVRTSVGGRRVRVRLANAFASTTVTIGSASIARSRAAAAVDTASMRRLTFGGQRSAVIYAGQVLIAHAHLRGIRVAGATLTPFAGSSAYSDAGEAVRVAVNEWIRTGREFDAVIDFDLAVRDPNDLKRFRAAADSPDMLHPGDAGYRLMADSIDLAIFSRR
jgi:lysophospholipase L1-like esterase